MHRKFTLIELLISIGIIAILITLIMIPLMSISNERTANSAKALQIEWEYVHFNKELFQRTPVPGGWLVYFTGHADAVYVPDANHEWLAPVIKKIPTIKGEGRQPPIIDPTLPWDFENNKPRLENDK